MVKRSVATVSVTAVSSSIHCQKRARGSSSGGSGGVNGASSTPSIAAAAMTASRIASRTMLAMWLSIEMAASRGSRPTQMYVMSGRTGRPSSGVCDFMKRRWVCASSVSNTVRRACVIISTHGDSFDRSSGRSSPPKTSSAQIICVHVVPHFGGVLITMSPGRNSKPSQRALSAIMAR